MSTASDAPSRPTRVVDLLGRADRSSAFAMVNAHWFSCFEPRFQVRKHERESAIADDCEALIWADWEQPFEEFSRPPSIGSSTPAIAVRPWDFGPYPRRWVEQIERSFQMLCVHSEWIRGQAIEAGVPEHRVEVVSLGCDTGTFRPDGPEHALADANWFTFLFCGASVRRKGLDVLLAAFSSEFAPDEGVRLVVKDRPVDVFYGGLELTNELESLGGHARSGAFVHLHSELSTEDLAALYRAADVTVFPYRAEGFALPILESLASGTPAVVPRFGACLDYCGETECYFAPHRRIRLPVRRMMPYNSLGFSIEVDAVDFCEVTVEGLGATLRSIVDAGRSALEPKRQAAVERASRLTWEASTRHMERLIEGLL